MITSDIKIAMSAILSNKVRSFLTMLGIVIGVFSLTLVVALGEGVKSDIRDKLTEQGADLIVVRPGRGVERDASGAVQQTDFLDQYSSLQTPFTKGQADELAKLDGVKAVAGVMVLDSRGSVNLGDKMVDDVLLVGTTSNYAEVVDKELVSGQFFEDNPKSVVISQNLAKDLFNEDAPLARSFKLKNREVTIIGTIDDASLSLFNLTNDFRAVYLPISTVKQVAQTQELFNEITVQVEEDADINKVATSMRDKLIDLRSDEDFSYLAGIENADSVNTTFGAITNFLAIIAVIIFLVGGIGIMNVMLTNVSEREYEIGIRKAIGAPGNSIWRQFLVESVVLAVSGAILGIVLAYLVGVVVVAYTDLSVGLSLRAIAIAILCSMIVGIVFGSAPALKASTKSPIQALRRE